MRSRACSSASTSYSSKSIRRISSQSRMSRVYGQPTVPNSSKLATAQRLQILSDDVVDGGLHLLNARDVVRPHHDEMVGDSPPSDLTPIVAEERDRQKLPLSRFLERSDDVPRSTAGGHGNRHVVRAGVGDELPHEDHLG